MGWTSGIAKKIIVFVLILFAALYIVFPGRIYGIEWIAAALLIICIIISSINFLSKKWLNISESKFYL